VPATLQNAVVEANTTHAESLRGTSGKRVTLENKGFDSCSVYNREFRNLCRCPRAGYTLRKDLNFHL
jgi:hypothetical protein